MAHEFSVDQLRNILEVTSSLNFGYLDKAVKELNEMDLKNADKFSEVEKQKFNFLHTAIAVGLDVTHRSYPVCYDLFPEAKANLDNAYAMFKRFEKAKLLKECQCDYCKQNPMQEELLKDDSPAVSEEKSTTQD